MDLKNVIENEYFDWLYNYVCKNKVHRNISYKKLFMMLHDTDFIFSIPNDVNRAMDGVDLRYRFANEIEMREGSFTQVSVILQMLEGPCSVLEMIIALAIRCEENIMADTRYGDRTGQWFWSMLSNLDLNLMTDDIYDREYVKKRIDILLYHRYEPDGKGGLFYIRDCTDDLREVEIWIQLCWYLDKFV